MWEKDALYRPIVKLNKNIQTVVANSPNNSQNLQTAPIAKDSLTIAILAAIAGAIATECAKLLIAKFSALNMRGWEHKKADDMLVAISIVQAGKLILMSKRNRVPDSTLGWSFPSARVRRGEVITKRLKARYREKYGIEVNQIKKVGDSYLRKEDLKILYFHCRYDRGTLENLDAQEIEEVDWIDVREAENTADARVHPTLLATLAKIVED